MTTAINVFAIINIVAGLIFFTSSVVGMIRLPDFYTRMHAAGKGDTLSSFLILFGFAIYHMHDFNWMALVVAGKIMLICFFIFTTSPTTTHALMRSGFDLTTAPWRKKSKNELAELDDSQSEEPKL